jgi:hypothetical protein
MLFQICSNATQVISVNVKKKKNPPVWGTVPRPPDKDHMTNCIIIDYREEVHLVMRPMTGRSGHGGWRRVITQFRRAAGVRFAPTLKEEILFFLPASSFRHSDMGPTWFTTAAELLEEPELGIRIYPRAGLSWTS